MKINSDHQFQPTQEAVSRILSAYGLTLLKFKPATTGIENCTLFITTDKGEYVMRIYRRSKKSDEEINAEIDFIDYLDRNHIPIANIIENSNGSRMTKTLGWQSVLMPKMPGSHTDTYNPTLVENLSSIQSKMHLLSLQYKKVAPSPRLEVLSDTIFLPNVDVAKLNREARLLIDRGIGYSVELPDGLPSGLCHLDYDKDNVLIDDQNKITAVLDFDDLMWAPFAVCLGYTLWDIAMQEDMLLVDQYLKTYSSFREINEFELKTLPKIMLFRHYMISGLCVLEDNMNQEMTKKFLRIEKTILEWKA